jgi:hypothetical protein
VTPLGIPAGAGTTVRAALEACRRHLRRLGGGGALLLGLGVAAAALPVGFLVAGAGGWRPGSVGPLLLVLGGGVGGILAAGWILLRLRSVTEEEALVRRMEEAAGLPEGRLRAQLELDDAAAGGAAPVGGTSAGLVASGRERLLPALSLPPDRLSGAAAAESRRLFRLGAGVAGGMAVVILLLLLVAPDRSTSAWGGLVRPVAILNPAPLPPMVVEPGDLSLPRGDSVLIRVEAPGRGAVVVHLETPGDLPRRIQVPGSEAAEGVWSGAVTSPTRYRVEGDDGSVTPDFLLTPLDPLLLERFALELRYPAFTGLPPERRDHPPEALELPAGTELLLSGRIYGVAERLALVDADAGGELAALGVEGSDFAGRWVPTRSGRVGWEAQGEFPAGHRLPPPFEVELLPDLPPEVHLAAPFLPDGSGVLPPGDLVLRVVAADDWGLDWVELQVDVFAGDGPPRRLVERTDAEGRTELVFVTRLDPGTGALPAGARIRVRAVAADRGVGPGIGSSETLEFRLPEGAEARREARERVEEAAEALAGLTGDAAGLEDRIQELRRDQAAAGAGAGGGAGETPADIARAEALERALQGEADLRARMDALRESLARGSEALGRDAGREAGASTDLRRLLDELDRAFESAHGTEARAELRQALERLEEAAAVPSSFSEAELSALLEQAEERSRALQERLEALREEAREGALRSGLDGLREEASSLARDQRNLADERSARGDTAAGAAAADPALAARQEELLRRAEEASTALERLEAERRGDGAAPRPDGGVSEALERARGALDEAREQMARAGGDPAGGAGDADDAAAAAADAAERARDALDEAGAEMAEAREARIREELTGVARGALSLAALPEASAGPALVNGAALLARDAGGVLSLLGDAGRELSVRLGSALRAAERIAAGGGSDALSDLRGALRASAVAALELAERGGESAGGEAAERSLAEALEELARQQEALNQDAGDIPGGGDPTGGATPMPGATGEAGELAGRQEQVAAGLGELSRLPGGERVPGNLEDLAREARELARELAGLEAGERPSAELRERQDRLLDRMLDAGRTLERDGPTEERRGRPAGPVLDRPQVAPLPEGLLRGARILLPSEEALAGLTPGERRLVLDYFERLRREGGR